MKGCWVRISKKSSQHFVIEGYAVAVCGKGVGQGSVRAVMRIDRCDKCREILKNPPGDQFVAPLVYSKELEWSW